MSSSHKVFLMQMSQYIEPNKQIVFYVSNACIGITMAILIKQYLAK